MKRASMLFLLWLAGCAPATVSPRVPVAADIPRLQALLLRDSANLSTRVHLAVAYRDAGRLPEARRVLESVVREQPNDAGSVLLLGLIHEEAGEWAEARTSYQRYLEVAEAAELRGAIAKRLPYVQRKELEAVVHSSLAHEAELTANPPDPANIAVFPFVLQSADTTLRPLSRALAELLVTDLALTDRVHVLERAQVQMLLDEIALGRSGLVDPATAARTGRLLRAGRIVQGSIQGSTARLRVGAVLAAPARDSLNRLSPFAEEDAIARLFDMEKRLALSLYRSLGVQLTAAERERVLQKPTENLQALLAYGRALEAEDRGDWAEAARQYARAAALDPGFTAAAARSATVTGIAEAAQTRAVVLLENGVLQHVIPLMAETPHPSINDLHSTPLTLGLGQTATSVLIPDPIRGILPDPLQRDPGSEILGREGVSSPTLLRIIFRRPGQ